MSYQMSERELHTVWSVCPECDTQSSVQIEIPSFVVLERLKAENARYRKALEKYANPKTHSMDEDGELWYGDYFDYKTARDALKGRE